MNVMKKSTGELAYRCIRSFMIGVLYVHIKQFQFHWFDEQGLTTSC